KNRPMIKGNGSNECADCGQRESFCATGTENSSRLAVRGETKGLDHFPLGKMTLDLVDIAPEALQDLGHNHARKGERLCIGYHPAQLSPSATRRRTEEVDPNRGIDQNQTRFLRANLKLPFQIPMPWYRSMLLQYSER